MHIWASPPPEAPRSRSNRDNNITVPFCTLHFSWSILWKYTILYHIFFPSPPCFSLVCEPLCCNPLMLPLPHSIWLVLCTSPGFTTKPLIGHSWQSSVILIGLKSIMTRVNMQITFIFIILQLIMYCYASEEGIDINSVTVFCPLHSPDNWLYYTRYLTSGFKLRENGWKPPDTKRFVFHSHPYKD